MKVSILSILLIFLTSCHGYRNEDFIHIVKEWEGKEIRFPKDLVFSRFATETTDFHIPTENEYKIIVYADSIGCISCKLQLREWKKFIAQVDSATGKNVPFLFFFQSTDESELRHILKRDNFTLPVCIDKGDRFYKLNHFSKDIAHQTFLIDKNNRVRSIGNPIHNWLVRDLYLKILTGTKAHEPTLPVTQIQVDTLEFNLGVVPFNSTKIQAVRLHNQGSEIFRLKGVTSSCDCTTVRYDWKEIYPGETRTISISYQAEQTGDFLRTVTIYGNIPEKSVTITFLGTVAES